MAEDATSGAPPSASSCAGPVPLDACPVALASVLADGTITQANVALAARLGLEPSALQGRRIHALTATVAAGRDAFARMLDGATPEVELRGAGGEGLWCRWTAREVDGAWLVAFEDVSAQVRDRRALSDAQVELHEAHARLVQAEKMASLGMLVAGIAHEINTPIGAVSSMHATLVLGTDKLTRLLAAELEGGLEGHPKVGKILGIIEDANRVIADGSGRVMNIVRRLKSFARLDETELGEASLEEGLEDTLTLIHHELKRDVTVHRDYGKLPRLACFPGRLEQVFLNLLMNAKQAMPEGGEIRVRTWSDAHNSYASVSDTGVGIAQDNLQKVFEPGFTTKGVGVGTGLGLSICRQIIQEHFGDLSVESALGEGTTFTVRIPHDVKARHEARRAASRAASPASE